LFRFGGSEHGEARKSFEKAIDLNPIDPRYYSNLGGLLVAIKDYPSALEFFDRAIEIRPSDGTLQKNRDAAEMLFKVRATNFLDSIYRFKPMPHAPNPSVVQKSATGRAHAPRV
jgi:tetratricopeptide (TPR) repeat protein